MSLEGEMMKVRSEFQDSIRNVAMKHMTDRNGVIKGTQRYWGYVCALHFDNPSDSNYGTVDVQEYMCDGERAGVGFHPNVYLSSLPNNEKGMFYVPELFSDVVISQDPLTKIEYVVMFSHLKAIQLRSHETAEIGVAETEKFEEGGEVDVHELAETGNYTKTSYDKDGIIHDVKGKTITTMDDSQVRHDVSGRTLTITKDKICHDSGSEHMVKGDTLKGLMGELIDAICQIVVPTAQGPSGTPMNVAAFNAIKSRLETMYSQISYLD